MKREIKSFVKLELSLYRLKKVELKNRELNSVADYHYFCMLRHIVTGIEIALSTLPKEIKQYAIFRYFGQREFKRTCIAKKFKVSERTVARWDDKLLRCVALYMGVLKNEA